MGETLAMRASDSDRQEVVDVLRAAVGDGRLTMDEYLDRMGLAYQAVTNNDLVPLCADLPAAGPALDGGARSVEPAVRTVRPAGVAGMPGVLRVLWAIWLTAVSINLAVWLLVTVTSGHLAYPWPLWVAGPYGAALVGISVGVSQFRRSRYTDRRRMPHSPAQR